ncbi:hypothetical protein FF098_014900 [Parvularcula flava]|uniref:Uncharacterized protein n=1 Tax=Aquisalinus luteolus TaxID=1566827 RepID=A0A8J3A3B9_9PROT|nr:hypothetical protein [Aquisalinus luteolus]NHK29207.1 hypothetical protein [Aquisalinus luteolus]GGH99969.1 hypothetical protein GCM10011355_27160 [Aquisalinus luteolus]
MMDKLVELWNKLADLVIISLFVTFATVLLVKEWRRSRMIPLAAMILGPVFGLVGLEMFGPGMSIAATVVGTVMGPGIVLFMQKPENNRAFVQRALDHIFPPKK